MKQIYLALLMVFAAINIYANEPTGLTCTDPIIANIGANTANNNGSDRWFTYTATQDAEITISSCDSGSSSDTYVRIYDACNGTQLSYNDDYCSLLSQVNIQVSANDVIYINWTNRFSPSSSYQWTITETAIEPGYACSFLLEASTTNSFTKGINESVWYSYTPKKDCKIVTTNSSANTEATVSLFSSCYSLNNNFINSGSFYLSSGVSYQIKWTNNTTESFNWTLEELDIIPGEICTVPASAIIGNSNQHSLGKDASQWFVYTATKKCIIDIEDLRSNPNSQFFISSSCSYNGNITSGNNKGSFTADYGSTYIISWINLESEDFTWNLLERDFLPGEDCTNPKTASSETKNEYDLGVNYQWFSYEASKDCNIELTNTSTASNSYFYVYESCGTYYTQAEGSNSGSFKASKGVTYYVRWENNSADNFEWNLDEVDFLPGEVCYSAILATAGSANMFDPELLTSIWYRYIPTKTCNVELENLSSETSASLVVRTSCDADWNIISDYNSTSFRAEEGVTYYINWYGSSTKFNWRLEEIEFLLGEDCTSAITATVDDSNIHYFGDYTDQWYTYAALKDCKIELTNLDSYPRSQFYIYSACNSNSEFFAENTGIYHVKAGNTYFIKWNNRSYNNFNWRLKEIGYLPGENCSYPTQATASEDNVHFMGENNEQWYSYTATRDGKIEIDNFSQNSESVYEVYTGCDNSYFALGNKSGFFKGEKDVTYSIKIENNSEDNFKWSLRETDFTNGDICEVAIPATADSNNEFTFDEGDEQWFTYTATRNGKISISNLSDIADSYFSIHTRCDSYRLYGATNEGSFEVKLGQKYYINWRNSINDQFKWSLEELDAEEGDFCSTPKLISAGDAHIYPEGKEVYWYSFTATKSGKIDFGKNEYDGEYNDIEVLSSCNNSINWASNYTSFIATEGTTYLIAWRSNSKSSFNWFLRESDFEVGESCSTAIVATEGSDNTYAQNDYQYQWYMYRAKQTSTLNINSDLYSSITIYNSACSNNMYNSHSDQYSLKHPIIKGNLYFFKISSSNSFNFNVFESELESGSDCSVAEAIELNEVHTFHSGEKANYKYEVKKSGVLALKNLTPNVDPWIDVSKNCSYRIYTTYGHERIFSVEENDILTISANYIYSDVEWILFEKEYLEGEHCSTAFAAEIGIDYTHDAVQGKIIYSEFIAEESGKIMVIPKEENINAFVDLQFDCSWDTGEPVNTQLELTVEKGQTYYLRWLNTGTETFDWSIETIEFEEGEDCSTAILAEIDTEYTYAIEAPGATWYKYTPEEDEEVKFTSSVADDYYASVSIFKGCNQEIAEGFKELNVGLKKGITYYVRWYKGNDAELKWVLTKGEVQDGQICSKPISVEVDTDYSQVHEIAWYSYTATSNGIVELSLSNPSILADIDVYNSCDQLIETNASSFSVNTGEIYLFSIEINTYYVPELSWSLSIRELFEAEICDDAKPVVADELLLYNLGRETDQWYSYTPTTTGKLLIKTTSAIAETSVEVSSACGAEAFKQGRDYIELSVFEGSTYFIKWHNYLLSPFEWIIEESGDFEEGEGCINTIEVVADNPMSFVGSVKESVWYSYTALSNDKIVINNQSKSQSTYVSVYNDCNNLPVTSGSNGSSLIAEQGQVYNIEWLVNRGIPQFTWLISEEKIADGEICSYAHTANSGLNQCAGETAQWFKYIPEKDGTIIVSSCDLTELDTHVSVYESCDNLTPVAYNDDNCNIQSELEFDVKQGHEYYIKWMGGNSSDDSFDWSLEYNDDNAVNDNDFNTFLLFPNPARDFVTIDSERHIKYIRILNMQGIVRKEVSNPSNHIPINLKKGLYVVEVYFDNGKSANQKLMIK